MSVSAMSRRSGSFGTSYNTNYWKEQPYMIPTQTQEKQISNRQSSIYKNDQMYETELQYDTLETIEDYGLPKEAWFELDLSNMGIRALSKEIRYYPHITALYLNNNKLNDLPDDVFFELKSLVVLDISYNQLTRIPPTIGQLSNLEKLAIHQNKIAELPVELGQLHKLREIYLDGNPLTSPPKTIVQAGTEMVISYLRDRIPAGPPPPERRFISYLEPNIILPEKDKFRVLTYNVLAEGYANPDHYFYCPTWALDWEFRKHGLLKEILHYDCDIICLQEVEAHQFATFFQPEMAKAGYSGILAPKSRARTMEDWSGVDGCAIFFKRSRFQIVEEHIIEYQSIAMARHQEFADDPEAFSRLITKDNVATAIILQLRDSPEMGNGNAFLPASPSKTSRAWPTMNNGPKKHILVANTHIHWNPEHKDVKLIQVQMLLEELAAITGNKWRDVPMILAGDFNSTPDSAPYELLANGRLMPNCVDLEPFMYGSYNMQGMEHPFRISSSYAPIGEPPFTNYTSDFVGVLDYIWYTHDSLAVSKVLQPVDEENVRNTKLPNAYMNSDHIYLLSEFYLKQS